jgi:hypothetical protein
LRKRAEALHRCELRRPRPIVGKGSFCQRRGPETGGSGGSAGRPGAAGVPVRLQWPVGRDPSLPQARRKAAASRVSGAPAATLASVSCGRVLPRERLACAGMSCGCSRNVDVGRASMRSNSRVPGAGFRAMLCDDGEELGHASGRCFVGRVFHARVLVWVACCRGRIVKLFAKAGLLPHVRAGSTNPSLPMLPARPEPPPVRPLDARGEASAHTVTKYWKSLTRDAADRMGPGCGTAFTRNGSASW